MSKYVLQFESFVDILNEESVEHQDEQIQPPDENKLKTFFQKHWKTFLIVIGSVSVGVTASVLVSKYIRAKDGQTSPMDTDTLKQHGFNVIDPISGKEVIQSSSKEGVSAAQKIINAIGKEFKNDISTESFAINMVSDTINQAEKVAGKQITQDVTNIIVSGAEKLAEDYIEKFQKMYDDTTKAVNFINKEKDKSRNFSERPMDVYYTDYTKLHGIKTIHKKITSDDDFRKVMNLLTYKERNTKHVIDWFKKYPELIKNNKSTVTLNKDIYTSGAQVNFLNHFLIGIGKAPGTVVSAPIKNIDKEFKKVVHHGKSEEEPEVWNREENAYKNFLDDSGANRYSFLKGKKK